MPGDVGKRLASQLHDLERLRGKGRRGLGVAGMRERLALIGGELEIESSIGVGTTVFVRIPADIARLTA